MHAREIGVKGFGPTSAGGEKRFQRFQMRAHVVITLHEILYQDLPIEAAVPVRGPDDFSVRHLPLADEFAFQTRILFHHRRDAGGERTQI